MLTSINGLYLAKFDLEWMINFSVIGRRGGGGGGVDPNQYYEN